MSERHLVPLELAKTALSLLQEGSDSEDELLALSLVTSAVALHLLKKPQTETTPKRIEDDHQSRSPSPEQMLPVIGKMSPQFEIRQEVDLETPLHDKADDSTISGAPVNDIKIELTSADHISPTEGDEETNVLSEDSSTSPTQRKRKREWSKFEDERRRVLLRLGSNDSIEQFCAEPKITDYMSLFLDSLKMDISTFNLLLSLVRKDIEHQSTCMRMTVAAEQRLAIVLRFLSTGESYTAIEGALKVSRSFLCVNIPMLCKALWTNLKDQFIKMPSCEGEWASKAEEFDSRWQFPLCLGVLTRRHFKFKAQRFSNVTALVDANSTFMHVSIERKNSESFTQDNLPPPQNIGNNRLLPYVFIANNGFELDEHIMTPHIHMDTTARQIFNARLKGSTRTADDAFRVMVERFKILTTPVFFLQQHLDDAVRACFALHNFLMQHNPDLYATVNEDGENIPELSASEEQNPINPSAEIIREEFTEYFANEGLLPTFDIKMFEDV